MENAEERKDGDYERKGYLTEDFRLFHLNDKKEMNFSYHYHEFDKVILFLHGNVKYMIEGREYDLKPYDFILVGRHEIHGAQVDFSENYERIILYVSRDFLCRFDGKEHAYSLSDCFHTAKKTKTHVVRFPANVGAELRQLLETVERDAREEKKEYAGPLQTQTDLIRFLIRLNASCRDEKYAFHPEAHYNEKIVEIIEYIMAHLGDDLSIDGIADAFFISKYHMMRLFKEDTGYSMHQYITEKRLLKAKSMLLSGETAQAASMECGFKEYSAFCRAFKKWYGMAPSEVK